MRHVPLRVAVVGVGHLGSRHAQIYASLSGVRLVAVCDKERKRALSLAKPLHCEALSDYRELAGKVDAVSLAVPTSFHAEVGLSLLRQGIHLLIEKPLATNLKDANALIREAQRQKCILQVGHVERFNAAIHAALKWLQHPRFIEVHRLSPYPFRGTDVSVVLDVMIHDLDLILLLVHSRCRQVEAVGIPVLSPSEDIANARVRFESGCIANLTASRISDEAIRRIRVFQEDSYLSIDYKAQTVELARKQNGSIKRVQLPVNQRPPLQDELFAFIEAVRQRKRPLVSGEEGRAALEFALRIERAMRRQ
ncbi:MAG: Gfo/Idh/MocA family oxidoreductase [Candidatus Omnitrophica bacterium]|nr:Gfo/Idh/MocA family oxidoreductase [Candidatus Omnitrophota bacterium]MBI2174185.1 Gfo/Idh/MocA family oxidoreductase [Candidatus Omnitrophota bacterium]MBI3009527.1 Gfo/Idh/MocA family oxidoreductase [Candidatus Omnitrophota bacterium]